MALFLRATARRRDARSRDISRKSTAWRGVGLEGVWWTAHTFASFLEA